MDNKEIQNLIRFVSKSGVAEVKFKTKDFSIAIKNVPDQVYTATPATTISQAPVTTVTPAAASENVANTESPKETNKDANLLTIKSPMIGTFYRKPGPDKDVFVNVGDSVEKGSVVCIIEAMKLFNEIESEVAGKVVKILVDDASPVEYDQPLYLVDPS